MLALDELLVDGSDVNDVNLDGMCNVDIEGFVVLPNKSIEHSFSSLFIFITQRINWQLIISRLDISKEGTLFELVNIDWGVTGNEVTELIENSLRHLQKGVNSQTIINYYVRGIKYQYITSLEFNF